MEINLVFEFSIIRFCRKGLQHLNKIGGSKFSLFNNAPWYTA